MKISIKIKIFIVILIITYFSHISHMFVLLWLMIPFLLHVLKNIYDNSKEEVININNIILIILSVIASIVYYLYNKNITTDYRTFIESFANTKEFINNKIYSELLSEYKNTMFTLRQTLQNFKNNKLTDKYPDTSEFFFIDNNIKTIDNLYIRLNNKISDTIFNNKYINLFDKSRTTLNNGLNNINNFIAQKHNIINSKAKKEDINYDFCLTFKRKIS